MQQTGKSLRNEKVLYNGDFDARLHKPRYEIPAFLLYLSVSRNIKDKAVEPKIKLVRV